MWVISMYQMWIARPPAAIARHAGHPMVG